MTRLARQVEGPATGCGRCEGVGLYYDRHVEAGRYGSLRLCSCVADRCRCHGVAPFQYWDEESRRQWCVCRPYRRRLVETSRLYRGAEIPERFRWKFLDDYHRATVDGTPIPYADRVSMEVTRLLEAKEAPRRGFFLHGHPGTGKTLLGCIMLNELILRWGRPARFLNLSRKYFEKLRDTYSEESASYGQTWQIMEELCSMPFLMLDDLGVQRNTEWEMEMLYNLVDARYGEERFTIVTTNKPIEEIRDLMHGRIHSRLVEMCVQLQMDGVDYRQHLSQ